MTATAQRRPRGVPEIPVTALPGVPGTGPVTAGPEPESGHGSTGRPRCSAVRPDIEQRIAFGGQLASVSH
ncbi:hypothetical protein ADZ36_28915 [Streptomyces fradiae]|uniref:Uncharacterized protein n=2 Tax=Streptomyces TaxID=1883 RepID=A0A3M8EXS7_9ACTN|nr:hypothetical protein ADZ36_28915 [Streptomyces fradiae]OFA57827.1 hypothetical protein BEN35_04635 [Streptomyces fradiae]PQM23655.1 hypothetical protein Sfr7A_08430 [Streptomyces xinghaiensis]RKM92320.1 hypothetical protein SFRA_025980 [Streptomyces xinghaiensis]RNC70291.1 hypothetical protein DC095_026970 [Streptomyces xinghaiensis]